MSEITQTRAERPKYVRTILFAIITVVFWAAMAAFLLGMLFQPAAEVSAPNVRTNLTEDFENMLIKKMSDVVEIDGGEQVWESTKRTYSLSDQDMVAPEPNPARYGTAEDPKELAAVLLEAQELLDIQDMLFTTETEIMEGSQIRYYLDETIFAITWKQVVGGSVYTFSEVKIAHASQFRRFLADGKYGASAEYTAQEMATSVNAVAASSGDYYGHRLVGYCVNEGTVYRDDYWSLDTCFVDENGDLLFTYRGEFENKAAAQAFVEEQNIRFSLSFGPVMIEDGQCVVKGYYPVGEINGYYPRAAICQMGSLHYVTVVSNYEKPKYTAMHTMCQFAQNLLEMGIPNAFALDGGQTATIVMDDQVINEVSYGAQRKISDIVYFATAIPEDEWE